MAELAATSGWVDRALEPLDLARAGLYRALAPVFGRLAGDREGRVRWLFALSLGSSFALTALVPLWSLCLGPLVLGVPHLLSDVRYLVVKPQLHRRRLAWLSAPLLASASFGAPPWVAALGVVPLVLAARGPAHRRALALGVALAVASVAFTFAWEFSLAFVHLHNLVALLVWWQWRAHRALTGLFPLATLAVAGVIVSGGTEGLTTAFGTWAGPATGDGLADFVSTTAPFENPLLSARLVLAFAFLQSVHYGVWLRLMPEEARERPAPRPFRASWRALRADFGPWALAGTAAVGLWLAARGLVDVSQARTGYLTLAAFHGYLELGALGFLFVERRP
jgi:hypothetical protein